MGEQSNHIEPDYSRPPVLIFHPQSTKSLIRKRAISFSSVFSTLALFVVTADVGLYLDINSEYYWGFSYNQWSPVQALFLLSLPVLATIRQCYIKPADVKFIWQSFTCTTLVLVGPFSMLSTKGIFILDFQRLGAMFLGYLVGVCVIEVLGMGCELVLKIFWNWLASFSLVSKRTKKPPMQVASEAQDLTEVEPIVSNQQFH